MLILTRRPSEGVVITPPTNKRILVTVESVTASAVGFSIASAAPLELLSQFASGAPEEDSHLDLYWYAIVLAQGDSRRLDAELSITAEEIQDNAVRVGIRCPQRYMIHRSELFLAIQKVSRQNEEILAKKIAAARKNRQEVTPAQIVVVWDPELLTEEDYAQVMSAVGNVVRSQGANGVKLIRENTHGLPVTEDVLV